ncbi:toll/interleukin-1 receptor domain-containing protein [Winogradskyella sp. A2]|uniref:toll/interleukin-1 receptor domain-containing protein n=1 Tax=Winogradskyella sp. A2 TaxID=3366944 RepID=UPI00398C513F
MKYNAFISYSHSKDSVLAPRIESALEKFAKPLFKKRALEIFRDANDLSASPDLWGKIEDGLDESEYFIFMASERAAKSRWCKKEVEHWKATKSMNNFLVVLTQGDLVWDESTNDFNWSRTTAIPKNLSGAFNNEPLYVDFREGFGKEEQLSLENPNFKNNIILLAATLHGKSIGDMVGEATLQHNKTLRIRNSVIAGLSTLLIAAIALAVFAFNQMNIAELQRQEAKKQANKALLGNYISAVQTEMGEDPTKALRLAEYAYRFAKNNELPRKDITTKLIQVFYSGNDFYLTFDENKKPTTDRKLFAEPPLDKDVYDNTRIPISNNDILHSLDKKYALITRNNRGVLIEPALYKYWNYFFPSVRKRKTFMNNRYPVTNLFFLDNGDKVLTESQYWPWDPEEFRPMSDGHDEFYYHSYKTEAWPYIEDLQNQMTDSGLKTLLFGDLLPEKLNIRWPLDIKTRVSSPIKFYSTDSIMYANNLGVYLKNGERLFKFDMPMDDLTSNYRFGFSEDNQFFYVDFYPVAPEIPELERRFIFPLHPELIIHRLNTMFLPDEMAELTEEDKKRFLIE